MVPYVDSIPLQTLYFCTLAVFLIYRNHLQLKNISLGTSLLYEYELIY